eukprot:1048181-Rhodomonas_salina.3
MADCTRRDTVVLHQGVLHQVVLMVERSCPPVPGFFSVPEHPTPGIPGYAYPGGNTVCTGVCVPRYITLAVPNRPTHSWLTGQGCQPKVEEFPRRGKKPRTPG